MTARALARVERRYDVLTPDERFRLVVAATIRGDTSDVDRLVAACPRETLVWTERAYRDRIDGLSRALDAAAYMVIDKAARVAMAGVFGVTADAIADGIRKGYVVGFRCGWRAAGADGDVPDVGADVLEGVGADVPHGSAILDVRAAAALVAALDAWAVDLVGVPARAVLEAFRGADLAARFDRVRAAAADVDPDPADVAELRGMLDALSRPA